MASIRFTGLSGIDTETLVTQLMDAEKTKLTAAQKKLKWYTWQQEAYRSMITTLTGFQSNRLSTTGSNSIMSTSTSLFNAMKITQKLNGAETNLLNITALGDNKPTEFDFEVLQVAKNDVIQSRNLVGTMDGNEITTLSGINKGDSFYVTMDGAQKKITIDWDDSPTGPYPSPARPTDSQLVDIINQELVNAFGTEKKQMYDTGATENIPIKDSNGVVINTVVAKVYTDEDGNLYNDYHTTIKEVNGKTYGEVAKVHMTADAVYDSSNMQTGVQLSFNFESARSFRIDVDSDRGVVEKLGFIPGQNITGKLDPNHVTIGSLLGGSGNSTADIVINNTTITIEADMTVQEFIDRINAADVGVTAEFDTNSNRFKISSNETGQINAMTREDPDGIFAALGFRYTQRAQDAFVEVNGEGRTLTTNETIVDGYQISFNQVSDGVIHVTTGKDSDAIVENIKAFVNEYNSLLSALTEAATTNRAKDANKNYYDPLTDEEEAEMTESQLEKWNEKAKTGLLYGDTAVKSIITQMRDVMMNPITLADGSKISLYDIGISTSGKDAQGQLTVDEEKLRNVLNGTLEGDNYASLRATLEKNPDAIQQMFSQVSDGTSSDGIAKKLNTIIDNATSTFSVGSSASAAKGSLVNKAGLEGTRWLNNNYFSRLIAEQNNRITKLLTSLDKKEERYYKMFASMEQAVSSNTSMITMLQSMSGISG